MPMHILFGDWFLFLEENYFKNHLKIYLNVLEKKKEKGEIFFAALGRKPGFPAPISSPSAQPHFLFFSGRSVFSPEAQPFSPAAASWAGPTSCRTRPLRLSSICLADVPGPRRRGVFNLPLVTEPVTRPSPVPPRFPPWLAPHVGPLLNSSPTCTAPPQP
jgi:hypothetical protein